MLHSRKSFLQLLVLASICRPLLVAQTNEAPTNEVAALTYLRRVNAAQVTYGSVNGRHTEQIEELTSTAKLPETPAGWRLTITVHDDKWDLVILQESKDAVIFVTDQTGMIRRGVISPIKPTTHNTSVPPSA